MKPTSNDLGRLFDEKCQAYDELKSEYQEMKELNQQIEKELEAEIEQLTHEKHKAIEQNEKVQHQLQELRQRNSRETMTYEKTIDRMQTENMSLKEELKIKNRTITMSEIEIERLESQLRESQSVICDLEAKIDYTFEKLAIIQSQLEETQIQNQEEVQRLKEKLRESQNEVIAYQAREARNKFEQAETMSGIFGSPNTSWNTLLHHYESYQAEGGDDPSPNKKVKVELGKRSYQHLNYPTSSQKSRHSENRSRPFSARGKNGNPRIGKDMSYSSNDFRSSKENARNLANSLNSEYVEKHNPLQMSMNFQNSLQSLDSLNMMNNGFSKSLLMVNDLIEELDKEPNRNQNQNFVGNTNFILNNQAGNMGLLGNFNQNARVLSQSLNFGQSINSTANLFSMGNNFSSNGHF